MKIKEKILVLAVLFSVIFLIGACDDMIDSSDDIDFPEEDVSWQEHVEPFLKITCVYGGCHDQNSGTPMNDYFAVMSNAGLVIVGKPQNSTLYQVLSGDLPHPEYFYDGDIKQNHIDGIKTWIEEGAKFN